MPWRRYAYWWILTGTALSAGDGSLLFVVIPAKAGIQALNNIGRQADSGYFPSVA
jgi:hypothetical protein